MEESLCHCTANNIQDGIFWQQVMTDACLCFSVRKGTIWQMLIAHSKMIFLTFWLSSVTASRFLTEGLSTWVKVIWMESNWRNSQRDNSGQHDKLVMVKRCACNYQVWTQFGTKKTKVKTKKQKTYNNNYESTCSNEYNEYCAAPITQPWVVNW